MSSKYLPIGYLENGYSDKYDVRYLLGFAQDIAASLTPMKRSDFRTLYRVIDSEYGYGHDFERQRMAAASLVPMAHNLVRSGRAPNVLIDFTVANAAAVTSPADYRCFRNHMEAICSYMS